MPGKKLRVRQFVLAGLGAQQLLRQPFVGRAPALGRDGGSDRRERSRPAARGSPGSGQRPRREQRHGIEPALVEKVALERLLNLWITRASISLPVPDSPFINTLASVFATSSICRNTLRIALLTPTISL